jgi:nicotinamide-nucleotide amidase
MVGSLLTDVPGSSAVFLLSAVTYANDMKERLLHVPGGILAGQGAVSEACARAMAEGVRRVSGSDLSVAVTGIAGPDGGTDDKPVGTVHFAVSDAQGTDARQRMFGFRDRAFVRRLAAFAALSLVHRRVLGDDAGH